MGNKNINFYATQDNGGGLALWVYDQSSNDLIYAHSGYEFSKGQLVNDINSLIEDGLSSDFEGNEINEDNENFTEKKLDEDMDKCEIIFQCVEGVKNIYPEDFGSSARREFNPIKM